MEIKRDVFTREQMHVVLMYGLLWINIFHIVLNRVLIDCLFLECTVKTLVSVSVSSPLTLLSADGFLGYSR